MAFQNHSECLSTFQKFKGGVMDIKEEKSELSETIKLVEAVLERLTFHAFEDVLIWSNEHASRALTLCLKKTLKEFENRELILTSSYPKLKHFSVDNVVRGLSTTLDQAQERQDNLNKEIDELSDQLTKAQSVPKVINVGNELQSWVAVWSFKARHDREDYIVVDANLLAEKIEKLTGANA